MNVLLSAVSSSPFPDGVSRHAANVAHCLLLQPEISHVEVVMGRWQTESMHTLLGAVDERLHISIADCRQSAWLRNQWTWAQLPRLARRCKSDVVHVSYPILLHKSSFSCPVVATLHDLYPYDIPENFGFPKVFLNRLILRQCLRAAGRIACVSDTTLQRLHMYFPHAGSKAVVVPNSIGAPSSCTRQGPVVKANDGALLLCVAQHRRNKNVPLAIEVFSTLLRGGDLPMSSQLLIVGAEGPETRKVEALITQHGLLQNVVLLHGLSESEIHWCYSNSDLLLAPSIVEGFGLPVVEAMVHRCRVVCSDIPAFREAGGAYCDYVPLSEDPVPAFAAAVRNALSNGRFRSPQLERFSSCLIGSAYVRLYRDLLEKPEVSPQKFRKASPVFERGQS